MWIRHKWSDVATVFCLILVAIIEAWNQTIRDAEDFRKLLPDFVTSPMLNYIPLVLLIIAGLIWLIGHIPRAIKKDSHLSIDYAGYGEQFGQYRNVTRQVQKLVEEKRLPIPVDDKSMGCDPNPGNRKCLFVIYSHGSHEGRAAGFKDGQLLVLPPDR